MAIFLGSSGNGILASRGAADLLAFLRQQANHRLSPAEADEEGNLLARLSHALDHEIAYEKATNVTFRAFLESLDHATFADDLAAAYQRCVALCKENFVHRQSVLAMHEMAGLAKDRLIAAAATLATKLLRLGEELTPTARFAILASGSSGRQEQTLRSNGSFFLIFEDANVADRDYFKRLKFQILALLKECGAAFIMGIGGSLSDGTIHDGRAPDYDDWSTRTADGRHGLNGDIFVWNPVLNMALELSSMGIRVDKEALLRQLEIRQAMERKDLLWHQKLLQDKMPLSIGGGIGQSRLCMYFLRKAHVGEIQASLWPDEMIEECRRHNIRLL